MIKTNGDKICKMSIRSVIYKYEKISHIVVIIVNHQSISKHRWRGIWWWSWNRQGEWCSKVMRNDVMTYRSINGTSPSYLQSCFTHVSDMTRWLRSFTSHRLEIPPVRLSIVGKLAFPVSGATIWNDLPLHVASASSLAVFRQRL